MIEIRLESPGQAPRVQRFSSTAITVGRATDCELCVEDPAASRRHCRISRGPAGWVIEDLGSINGTRVGGARISGVCELAPGDVVAIGELLLRVIARSQPVAEAPRRGPGPGGPASVAVSAAREAAGVDRRPAGAAVLKDRSPERAVPGDRSEDAREPALEGPERAAARGKGPVPGDRWVRRWAAAVAAVGMAGLGGWATAGAWDRPLVMPAPASVGCAGDDPRLAQADAAADAAANDPDVEHAVAAGFQAVLLARTAGCGEQSRAAEVLAALLARLDSEALGRHPAALRGLVVGEDARVAAIDAAGQVALWDRDAPGRVLTGVRGAQALARSPDGRWLAIGDAEGGVQWWDLADADASPQIEAYGAAAVQALRFDGAGRTIGVDADGSLQVWARVAGDAGPAAWTRVAQLQAWPGVTQVEVAGEHLLAFGAGRVAVWQIDRRGAVQGAAMAPATGAAITAAALDEAGAQVAIGDAAGVVTRWRPGRRARAEPLTAHAGPVHAVAWVDGAVASVGADQALRVAELDRRVRREGPPLVLVADAPVLVDRLAVAGAGQWLIGGGRDGAVVVWDMQQRSRRLSAAVRPGHRGAVTALAAGDGWVASGGDDGVVRAWTLGEAARTDAQGDVVARACRALGWQEPGCAS